MTAVTETLIGQMVTAVVEEVDPERVILFGSRARGEEREESDVDLVVVEAEPFDGTRSRHKEMVRLYKVLADFPVSADILVYTQDEVEYWRDSLLPSPASTGPFVVCCYNRKGRVAFSLFPHLSIVPPDAARSGRAR